jgi:hypothetical protein
MAAPTGDLATPLCPETHGRYLVAAIVNEALGKALGLRLAPDVRRAEGKPVDDEGVDPSK